MLQAVCCLLGQGQVGDTPTEEEEEGGVGRWQHLGWLDVEQRRVVTSWEGSSQEELVDTLERREEEVRWAPEHRQSSRQEVTRPWRQT